MKWIATSKYAAPNRKLFKKVYSAILDRQAPSTSEWEKIKMPVLLAHGGKAISLNLVSVNAKPFVGGDIPYPPSVARANYDLLSEAPNKEIYVVDNAAHLFTWPEAARVNPIFARFLRKYGATA
jgi:pimeloyl-ACP methyl ester carboxylesterase